MFGRYQLNAFVTSSPSTQGKILLFNLLLPESLALLNQERKKPSGLFMSSFPPAVLSRCEISLFVTAKRPTLGQLTRLCGSRRCLPLAPPSGFLWCCNPGHPLQKSGPPADSAACCRGPRAQTRWCSSLAFCRGSGVRDLSILSDWVPIAATPNWAVSARIFGAVRSGATSPGANFRPVCGLGVGSWVLLAGGWERLGLMGPSKHK